MPPSMDQYPGYSRNRTHKGQQNERLLRRAEVSQARLSGHIVNTSKPGLADFRTH